jgi:hypothetical protein
MFSPLVPNRRGFLHCTVSKPPQPKSPTPSIIIAAAVAPIRSRTLKAATSNRSSTPYVGAGPHNGVRSISFSSRSDQQTNPHKLVFCTDPEQPSSSNCLISRRKKSVDKPNSIRIIQWTTGILACYNYYVCVSANLQHRVPCGDTFSRAQSDGKFAWVQYQICQAVLGHIDSIVCPYCGSRVMLGVQQMCCDAINEATAVVLHDMVVQDLCENADPAAAETALGCATSISVQ